MVKGIGVVKSDDPLVIEALRIVFVLEAPVMEHFEGRVTGVAVEEMLHLVLATNTFIGVGGRLKFDNTEAEEGKAQEGKDENEEDGNEEDGNEDMVVPEIAKSFYRSNRFTKPRRGIR